MPLCRTSQDSEQANARGAGFAWTRAQRRRPRHRPCHCAGQLHDGASTSPCASGRRLPERGADTYGAMQGTPADSTALPTTCIVRCGSGGPAQATWSAFALHHADSIRTAEHHSTVCAVYVWQHRRAWLRKSPNDAALTCTCASSRPEGTRLNGGDAPCHANSSHKGTQRCGGRHAHKPSKSVGHSSTDGTVHSSIQRVVRLRGRFTANDTHSICTGAYRACGGSVYTPSADAPDVGEEHRSASVAAWQRTAWATSPALWPASGARWRCHSGHRCCDGRGWVEHKLQCCSGC